MLVFRPTSGYVSAILVEEVYAPVHTEPPFDSVRFRHVLGHLPTGVGVVTATDSDGRPAGMAVGSITSVSLTPPLIAFLPAKSSTTFPRIRSASSFCVNILATDQQPLCATFAKSGGDKFADVAWHPSRSGSPILAGVVAWVDCAIDAVHEAGDHYIVVGAVLDLDVPATCRPLVFYQGGYHSLDSDVETTGHLTTWSGRR